MLYFNKNLYNYKDFHCSKPLWSSKKQTITLLTMFFAFYRHKMILSYSWLFLSQTSQYLELKSLFRGHLCYFFLSIWNLSIWDISLYRINMLVPSYKISLYLKLWTVKTTIIIESTVKHRRITKQLCIPIQKNPLKIRL